jgi:diaminopimelate epimerase
MARDFAVWNGHPFVKMSGSGNDFVVFDTIASPLPEEISHEIIVRICNRRNGIGADGVVVLGSGASVSATVSYYNADGSLGELCGNATLCSTALCVSLGYAQANNVRLMTDAGLVAGTVGGDPEIRLQPIEQVVEQWNPTTTSAGELRSGFARIGVPHVVTLVEDVAAVDIDARGRELRYDPSLGRPGANANFVSRSAIGAWRLRTFERGVEAETLACGTGAVATAAILRAWRLAPPDEPVVLETRSGRMLRVRLTMAAGGATVPMLRGEGRVVFSGAIGSLGD